MTEALRAYEYDDYSAGTEVDDDLSTSYLENQAAIAPATDEPAIDDSGPLIATDWLALLTPEPPVTTETDEPAAPAPAPQGMSQHLAPPRMRPTLTARLGSGLRRGTLAILLAGVAAVALAGGAYVLLASGWISLTAAPAQPPAPQAHAQPQPASPNQPDIEQLPPPTNGKSATTDFAQMRQQGVSEMKAGHYDRAIDLLENAAAVNERDAVTEYQLGLAYLGAGSRDHASEDAELAFRSAVSLQPKWSAAYRLLAESLMRQGRNSEAVASANSAVQLDKNAAENWVTLGTAYQRAGFQTEATKAFAQASRLAPAPPSAP